MAEFVRVATLSDVGPGQLLGVEVQDTRICLVNSDGEIYALQDNCSHKDFPLSAAELDDGKLVCAWHGAKFDAKTGRALALPAIRPVRTFEVRIEGDDILVAIG